MVLWPCFLKLYGDDELIYLRDEQSFTEECEALILSDEDYVVDSLGCRYLLELTPKKLVLINTEQVLLLDDVTALIRAHEFVKAEVCLTKIHFLTISDAIKALLY